MDGDQVSDKDLAQVIGFVLKKNRKLIKGLATKRDRDELGLVAQRVVEHFRLCGYRTYGTPALNHGTAVMQDEK